MTKITVLLAEDHQIVREGLRALLNAEKDIEVLGEAENGRQTVELARQLRPEVVVMDIAMPLLNGLEATRQILRASPSIKVIILSAHSDDAYVEHVMELGAAGYLVKQTAADALIKAIRAVHKGQKVFSPAISMRMEHQKKKVHERGAGIQKSGKAPKLTSREAEVLQLIAEGNANKQTAGLLGISIKTVEKHRQSLMKKLHIHDTAGLTRYAIASGFIESSVQKTVI